jgi:hypothetical protein
MCKTTAVGRTGALSAVVRPTPYIGAVASLMRPLPENYGNFSAEPPAAHWAEVPAGRPGRPAKAFAGGRPMPRSPFRVDDAVEQWILRACQCASADGTSVLTMSFPERGMRPVVRNGGRHGRAVR